MDDSTHATSASVRRSTGGTAIAIGLNLVVAATALLLASCAAGTSDAPTSSELSVWSAGEPTFSIGVLEGAEEYEFGLVVGVAEFADGRIAVSDAGVGSVSVFDADGVLLRRIGAFGEGPGEFGTPSRVYAHGADSIAVLDQRRWAISYFGLDGEWARQAFASDLSGEDIYPMDVFPVSRFIVDGVTDASDRARVGATVAALPAPTGHSLVRFLKVANDGSMWIEEAAGDSVTASEWMVLGSDGRVDRWAQLPAGFTPFQIDGDVVLGRRVGEYGVEYVERYELARNGETRPAPTWFTAPAEAREEPTLTRSELFAESLRSVKVIASQQEMNYARAYSYTTDFSQFDIEPGELPEEIEFRILSAGSRGWAMVVAHPDVATVCTLGYGLDTPPGWGKGSVDCGTLDGTGVEPMYEIDATKAPQTKGEDRD